MSEPRPYDYESRMPRAQGPLEVVKTMSPRGTPLEAELPTRLDLANHSPDGFGCGYLGSGPAQLALAILADAVSDALALYQRFKQEIVAKLSHEQPWQLSLDAVLEWVEAQPEAGIQRRAQAGKKEEHFNGQD